MSLNECLKDLCVGMSVRIKICAYECLMSIIECLKDLCVRMSVRRMSSRMEVCASACLVSFECLLFVVSRTHHSVLQCDAVCCSVLQRVAVSFVCCLAHTPCRKSSSWLSGDLK